MLKFQFQISRTFKRKSLWAIFLRIEIFIFSTGILQRCIIWKFNIKQRFVSCKPAVKSHVTEWQQPCRLGVNRPGLNNVLNEARIYVLKVKTFSDPWGLSVKHFHSLLPNWSRDMFEQFWRPFCSINFLWLKSDC